MVNIHIFDSRSGLNIRRDVVVGECWTCLVEVVVEDVAVEVEG